MNPFEHRVGRGKLCGFELGLAIGVTVACDQRRLAILWTPSRQAASPEIVRDVSHIWGL